MVNTRGTQCTSACELLALPQYYGYWLGHLLQVEVYPWTVPRWPLSLRRSPYSAPPPVRSPIATLHRALFAVLPLAFFLWRSPFAAKLYLLNGTRKQQKKKKEEKKKTEGGGGKGVELWCCVFVFAFKRQLVLSKDIQHIWHLYSHQELRRKGEEKRIWRW